MSREDEQARAMLVVYGGIALIVIGMLGGLWLLGDYLVWRFL